MSFGLGLRFPHKEEILTTKPKLDFFEIISENYINAHKGYIEYLEDLRADYSLIMHGVGLSIGSFDKFDVNYLSALKNLSQKLEVGIISDHLCYTGTNGYKTHDLLPIAYTTESLKHIISRINKVQDFLGKQFTFENASSYIEFKGSTIHEADFLNEICTQTGCKILLDVNNVYVSCYNNGWNEKEYIDKINSKHIAQHHLAGYKKEDGCIIDTHDNFVSNPVWNLFEYTIKTKGFKPTMIEWDDNIPTFSVLLSELEKAKSIVKKCIKPS